MNALNLRILLDPI